MFIDLGEELYEGLAIIDPALAQCCNSLYISKGDFLSFMSNSIEWVRSDESSSIHIKTPNAAMLSVDLDSGYQQAQTSLSQGDKHYWPHTALDDYKDNTNITVVTFEDDSTAKEFRERLKQHSELLREAKEKLRELLKDSFSVEEILFQNDSHPWR